MVPADPDRSSASRVGSSQKCGSRAPASPGSSAALTAAAKANRLTAADAAKALDAVRANTWHRFWPDAIPYEAEHLGGINQAGTSDRRFCTRCGAPAN